VSRETWRYSASKERLGRVCVLRWGVRDLHHSNKQWDIYLVDLFLVNFPDNRRSYKRSAVAHLSCDPPEICRQCTDVDKRVFFQIFAAC